MPRPSRANWTPGNPRDCSICGKKLRITKDRIWFKTMPPVQTFCDGCIPHWKLTRKAMVTYG